MAIKLTWSALSLPHQRIDPELGATGIRELSKGEYPDHPDAKTKILGERFDWFVKETGIRHRDVRESRLR
jgi:hypothetical protein